MKKVLGDLGEDAIPEEPAAVADNAAMSKTDDRRGPPGAPPPGGRGLSGLTEFEGAADPRPPPPRRRRRPDLGARSARARSTPSRTA